MISPSSPLITRSLVRTVDDMLLDAGETDAGLRSALLSLGSLRSLPVPEPGAELAALLMSGPANQLVRQRLLRRHRSSVVGLAVIAGMGLGVTGVAATGSVPDGSTNSSIQQMLEGWTPSWTVTGKTLAGQDAGILVELQTSVDRASGDKAVGDGAAGLTETYLPRATQSERSGPGASRPGDAQGSSGSAGTGKGNGADGSSSTAGDGGAAGDGGNAAKDAESGDQAGKAGSDTASGQDKTGKSGADSTADQAATSLAKTGKTADGNTDPGQIWLNKFSR